MKTRFVLLALLFINFSLFAQKNSKNKVISTPEGDLYTVVEQKPMFPGCEEKPTFKEQYRCSTYELSSFIRKNLVYPEPAKKNEIEGRVRVKFIVEKDGSLSNIELMEKIGNGFDEEALRIVGLMVEQGVKWHPARVNGEVVRALAKVSVSFKMPLPKGVFRVVDDMPRFPGCEDMEGTKKDLNNCANKALLKYTYTNLKYPEAAKKEGIEGRVFIGFIVEKDGTLSNIKLKRDIGGGCGEEALRVINLMNEQNITWIPGKQKGEPVMVQYTMPIAFKLD